MSKRNRNRYGSGSGSGGSSGAKGGAEPESVKEASAADETPAADPATEAAPAATKAAAVDDDDDEPEMVIERPEGGGETPAAAAGGDEPAASAPAEAAAAPAEAKLQLVPAEEPATEVKKPVAIRPSLEPIVERLRAGRCVLCVGAGFEAAVGMPSFRETLEQLLAAVGSTPEVGEARKLLEARPFVTAGFVRRRLADRFPLLLRAASQTPSELPETVRLLGELPFRAIVTSSYSDLFTRAFARKGEAPHVYTPRDIAGLKRDSRNRYVLMALGDPAREETVLFTSEDIQLALTDEAYRGFIHDVYRHRSLLFLGFSAGDIELFWGRLFAGAHSDQAHYAVLPGLSHVEAEELEATFHITSLDEKDLSLVVRELREAIGDFDADAPPDDDDLEGWIDVLAHEPSRADALDKLSALEKKLAAKGDHERLLELHLGLAEVVETPTDRARQLREVARLFENHIGDLGKAFTALVAAHREDHSAEIAGEMERLAAATGMWSELVTAYTELVPHLEPAERPGHWLRVAHLYSDKLNHEDYALSALDEALKLDAAYVDGEEYRIELLRKGQRWKPLAEALGHRATTETLPSRKSDLFVEQGDVYEARLSDGVSAAVAYRRALDAEPGNAGTLAALEHLFRRRGEFADLLPILDEKIKTAEAEERTELRKEAAALAADKLGDRKQAIERYEALRADQESDLSVLRPLETLYLAAGRTDDYFEVLAAQAEAHKEDREKIAIYRRLGSEWEDRPGGRVRAAEYLEKLLALDPRAEDALLSVEKLYAAEQKWEALVDAYRRHADLPNADRVTLHSYIGQVFEGEINDPLRAIPAFLKVEELSPANEKALASLTRLYQRTEAWTKVVEYLEKQADLARSKEEKVGLIHEAALVTREKLSDPKAAEARHARALGVDPTHVPSMLSMVELYRKSGEFLRAAKLLVEAETHTLNRLEKTRILVEAGEIYDGLEEPKTSADLYLRALSVDPEHVEAGGRVAELLWKAERWADLVPVLEMLTRKEADRETQRVRWQRLGRASKKLEQKEKALKAYNKAAEIDPTDLEAQQSRGDILFGDGKWTDAREAYQAVLHHHRDEVQKKELIELFFRLGECARQGGEIDKARNFYGKALEIDPTHRPTILAQIDVGSGDPKQVIENKRALLATASLDEKVQLLTQIGEAWLDKLETPAEAIKAFQEALALKPDARSLLHRCLEIHVEQKAWKDAVEMLRQLTDLEQVASVRAKLRFTSAMIYKDEMTGGDEAETRANREKAAALLTEAIDDDINATSALKELEELLLSLEAWKDLTRYYRRSIKRLGAELDTDSQETRKERLRVWSRLGEITLEKLGEKMSALAALEVAATLDRGNLKRQEQLAELYIEAGPDHVDKAITAHQTLLRSQHDRVASYRALRALYGEARQPEKALALAYALALLKKGDPDDAQLVTDAKQRPLVPVRRNLDEETWLRNVAHPDENPYVDGLFTQLMPFIAVANGRSHKELGLNRKEKLENTDPRSFAKGLRYVAAALDARLPYETYVRYEQRAGLAVANCIDKQTAIPAVVIGQPMLGDKRPERELIFELTKTLTHMRPERYLRLVLPQASQLGMLIDAAIALAVEAEGGAPAGGVGEVARKGQELKRALPPKTLQQVVFLGSKLKGQKGADAAATWLAATELTSTRAAFLLIQDLEQTAKMVALEPPTVSTHDVKHRLKELIWFTVTEECFAAKRHLGLP